MTLEGVLKIEESLGIKLPEYYKKVVLDNPLSPERISERLNINIPNPYDIKTFKKDSYEARMISIFCDTLYDDPDMVIKLNNRLRGKGLKGKLWMKNLFAISCMYNKEYYFINLDEDEENIYLANNKKDWEYTPENLKNNLAHHDLDSFLSTALIVLKSQERRRKGVPETPIDVNEFLLKMNEEIVKQQNKNT